MASLAAMHSTSPSLPHTDGAHPRFPNFTTSVLLGMFSPGFYDPRAVASALAYPIPPSFDHVLSTELSHQQSEVANESFHTAALTLSLATTPSMPQPTASYNQSFARDMLPVEVPQQHASSAPEHVAVSTKEMTHARKKSHGRRTDWPVSWVIVLLELYREKWIALNKGNFKRKHWGAAPSTWEYYDRMSEILARTPKVRGLVRGFDGEAFTKVPDSDEHCEDEARDKGNQEMQDVEEEDHSQPRDTRSAPTCDSYNPPTASASTKDDSPTLQRSHNKATHKEA
ncbi:hypothetical protein L7F22_033440 [Adiantum nelumboides]|nr:hypothetical protein [Adiantum nelumboides]